MIDFIEIVKTQVRLLLVNYTVSDDDLDIFIDIVFSDIAISVPLLQFSQRVQLFEDQDTYDLDSLLCFDSDDRTVALGVYSIETDCGIDYSRCWTEVCRNTFCMVPTPICSFDCYPVCDDGNTYLLFKRSVIPDMKQLDDMQRMLIIPVLVEGIVERVTEMIPSPISSGVPIQEEGYRNSKYEKAKINLINKLPQYL